MSVYLVDPVRDRRWAELVGCHPRASVFHSVGWLEALQATHGYRPFALSTCGPDAELTNGVLFCHVRTWLANRAVSLPFSDHCEPLVDRSEDLREILSFLAEDVDRGTYGRADIRPLLLSADLVETLGGFALAQRYCLHIVDLTPPVEEVFGRFHGSCTQRPIRRAEREGLTYERGNSDDLLEAFYELLVVTRRRHGLPPHPVAWFRNLIRFVGDDVAIHAASKNGQPIAAILTLSFRKTMVYKYGCSDAAHHKLGGMPFLFWQVIRDAKQRSFKSLDLGRSDLDQPGLIAFKEHLGASRTDLDYYSHPRLDGAADSDGRTSQFARRLFSHMPDGMLKLAGSLMYRHLG